MSEKYQCSDFRPCTVGANDETEARLSTTVDEVYSDRSICISLHTLYFLAPADLLRRHRAQKHGPEVLSIDLGSVFVALSAGLEVDSALRIGNFGRDVEARYGLEVIQQAGSLESEQTGSGVEIEGTASAATERP